MALRRCLLVIIFVFIVSSLLCGCEGFLQEKPQEEHKSENIKNNVKVDKIKISYAQWSVPSVKQVEEVIQKFNGSNSHNIYVEVMEVPLDRYIETLNMLNSSGQGPDVFEIMQEWLNSYIHNNYVADISKFIDSDFLREFPDWIEDFTLKTGNENSLYSIPSTQITHRLIYNKDLFRTAGLNPEAPPKTLSELQKYAKAISAAEVGQRRYGFALPMGEEWLSFVQPMEAVNTYSGINFYDFEKKRYDLRVYEPWIVTFRELNENGGMFPGMGTMKSELALAQFAEGNVGMMYASSWQASILFDQFVPKCDWGVTIPPAIDEESEAKGSLAVNMAGWNVVNATTKYKAEAVAVWEFLYSKDYLNDLLRKGSVIPLIGGIEEGDFTPVTAKFNSFIPGDKDAIYAKTPFVMDEWPRIKAYLLAIKGNEMEKVLLEESNRLNSLLNTRVAFNSTNTEDDPGYLYTPRNPIKGH